MTQYGFRSLLLISSDVAPVAMTFISRMGGGSMTRRSLSPNPQARAAIGCWRMIILYLGSGL